MSRISAYIYIANRNINSYEDITRQNRIYTRCQENRDDGEKHLFNALV